MKTGSKNKISIWKILILAALVCIVVITGVLLIKPTELHDVNGETENLQGKAYVKITVQDYGDIVLELDADIAPITVSNFCELVENHFYDGLTFHRIISGFMIQGGDPKGNGTGGSEKKIKGEFSSNGFANGLKHTRGVISMARSADPNSASSQFFIMHQDAPHLDGQYAAFGKVIRGMETVDAICSSVPVTDNKGSVDRENQPIITSIRMISAEDAL